MIKYPRRWYRNDLLTDVRNLGDQLEFDEVSANLLLCKTATVPVVVTDK